MQDRKLKKHQPGWLILTAVLVLQCSRLAPTEPEVMEQASLSASLHMTDRNYSASNLDSLVFEITGKDVKPIRKKIIFNGVRIEDKIKVPAQKSLLIAATGYQDTTAVLYGSQTVDAIGIGKSANVHITLGFLVSTIILTPPAVQLTTGQQIEVFLSARNVIELATFGCLVRFDPTMLQVVELGRQDDFLKANRGTVTQLEFTHDNVDGNVRAVFGIFPASSAVSGSGNVGRIVFKALRSGITDVSIQVDNRKNSDLGLFNKNADLLYSVGLGSRITIADAL